jgi:hypothetical protein
MPGAVSYARANDPHTGLDVTVAAGIITRADMFEHVREQVADPSWPIGRVSLSDFRLVDELDINPEDLRDAASLYGPKADVVAQHKTAYLRSPAFRGDAVLGRQFEEQYGIGPVPFDDLASACDWLGVDPSVAERLILRLRAELGVTTSD